ncbi:TPA: insertion element protein, partial [Enterococcus faecium]
MTKLKRLATKEDEIVDVKIPISNEELKDRAKQYDLLTPKRFATRYNKMLFLPTSFKWNGSEYPIQYNYCINPFCCNFGKEQHKFKDVKGKPSRYKMTGSSKDKGHKGMYCNDNPIG